MKDSELSVDELLMLIKMAACQIEGFASMPMPEKDTRDNEMIIGEHEVYTTKADRLNEIADALYQMRLKEAGIGVE